MKYCEKCHVSVRGGDTVCPLCKHRLTGTGEPETYPLIPTVYEQHKGIFQRLGALSTLAGTGCIVLNIFLPRSGFWSAFVALVIVCFWVSLAYILQKQRDIPRTIVGQVAAAAGLCVLWDVFTGWHGWSLSYVFPFLCIGAMVSLAVFKRVLHMPVGDVFIYLFSSIGFGVVPLLLLALGLVRTALPSELCVFSSGVSFACLVLTEGGTMRSEIQRRFHF